MFRGLLFVGLLVIAPTVAMAQQPCTTNYQPTYFVAAGTCVVTG
jgi:hypothetical protein